MRIPTREAHGPSVNKMSENIDKQRITRCYKKSKLVKTIRQKKRKS